MVLMPDYSELSDGITLKSAISPFKKTHSNKKNKTIQIHLQTGKYGGNYKELCFKSLRDLLKLIKFDGNLILTGLGNNLSQDISILESNFKCLNYIDKFSSIFELMNLILEVDCLITPDGFPAFFAMSNQIPTIVLYTFPYALRRATLEWLSNSYSISSISDNFHSSIDSKIRDIFNLPPKLLKVPKSAHIIEYLEQNV